MKDCGIISNAPTDRREVRTGTKSRRERIFRTGAQATLLFPQNKHWHLMLPPCQDEGAGKGLEIAP